MSNVFGIADDIPIAGFDELGRDDDATLKCLEYADRLASNSAGISATLCAPASSFSVK